MSLQRLILSSALAAAWVISPVAAQTTTVTITRTYVFPPVTLASTETVRITVVNTATAPTAPTAAGSPAPSCTGTLAFTVYNGPSSTPVTPAPVSFTVGAGQFATADLPFSASHISTSPGEVMGTVTLSSSNPGARAPCNLLMSLEVFDATSGVGHVVLTNPGATGSIGPAPLPLVTGGR